MAITITATAGSASANSFATEAQYIAYVATRLNAPSDSTVSGSTATESEKAALIEATRDLSVKAWEGTRVDATQALSWPRSDVTDYDDPDEADYDEDVIPSWLVDATCELAMQYRKAGTTDLAVADAGEGVIRKRVDVLETEWEPGSRVAGQARFTRVNDLIARWYVGYSGAVRLVR